MNIRKIARDLGILIAFCGAFYLLVILVRGETTKASTSSNFSIDRLEGDRLMQAQEWEQAIVHFKRLVEKDKYNGLAQSQLSSAEMNILYDENIDYMTQVKKGALSKEELDASHAVLVEESKRCIEIQNKLIRFDQYRHKALRNLATLHAFIGKEDEAIEFLTEYIEDGNYTDGLIAQDEKFSGLRERDDFRKLSEIENEKSPRYQMIPRQKYFDRVFRGKFGDKYRGK